MRIIKENDIIEAVSRLCIDANCNLGGDVLCAIKKARETESVPRAASILDLMAENAEIARRESIPICQDTGMAVFFIEIGTKAFVDGNIERAVNEGVSKGYKEGYLRASVVRDPFCRENTRDNTPPIIHFSFAEGENIKITFAPKGFGSENMSSIKMLKPSDGYEGAVDFVVETVKKAGANPCPPIVVGVGVGGTMEKAAILSKYALTRDVGAKNPDPFYAEMEEELLRRINKLGIGPQGFSGDTTALAVHVEAFPTHIAGLPVAVNINCHVARHKTAII